MTVYGGFGMILLRPSVDHAECFLVKSGHKIEPSQGKLTNRLYLISCLAEYVWIVNENHLLVTIKSCLLGEICLLFWVGFLRDFEGFPFGLHKIIRI